MCHSHMQECLNCILTNYKLILRVLPHDKKNAKQIMVYWTFMS